MLWATRGTLLSGIHDQEEKKLEKMMGHEGSILIHLGSGMGNMLMATPMMIMLSRGGYQIDLCLQGETPGVEKLFENWPYVRAVSAKPERFSAERYDIYLYGFEVHGSPIKFANFDEASILHPVWDWNQSYELHSEIELYTDLARLIVPNQPLVTQTSCTPSMRTFPEISNRTCVLIPGGGKQMIIRKWHGYGALAEQLDDVAVVGLPSDLDMSNRVKFPAWCHGVFGKRLDYPGHAWRLARTFAERHDEPLALPEHAKNYIGALSLEDTAALIGQAGYVVGNDCGLTHLAVALGKPVFAIIGPTSVRKVFPSFLQNVTIIQKRYECQPCQEKPQLRVWREHLSQHFCPYHLRCMQDITVGEVLASIQGKLTDPFRPERTHDLARDRTFSTMDCQAETD
jgi:hypothetical protein